MSAVDVQTLHDNIEDALDDYVHYRNVKSGYTHSHPVKGIPCIFVLFFFSFFFF